MKIHIGILFLVIIFLTACNDEPNCQDNMVCTDEFRSVAVRFEDVSGNPVAVQDYSVVNLRTKQHIYHSDPVGLPAVGYYTVVSDNNKNGLSEKGDTILVSATSSLKNITKTTKFVVAGGICACHISKISGPDKVILE